jgi:hypothetical protein
MKKGQPESSDDRKPARTVIARPPPNWEELQSERAIRISFNIQNRSWTEEPTNIKVDLTPFANGALRMAYHMLDLKFAGADTYVLKVSADPNEDSQVYYRDVEMQLFAYLFAEKFNVYKPPKQVSFVKAWLVRLPRRGNQLCAVERFISGPYRKHNNNYGFVNEDERNTPQAFSHFSYEASGHSLLICDIQGVADMYTDPQIHTMAGDDKSERPFGKGNLGQRGIDQFLKTHRCNPICRYLKLPPINPKIDDIGTVPDPGQCLPNPIEKIIISISKGEGAGGRLEITPSLLPLGPLQQPAVVGIPNPLLQPQPQQQQPAGAGSLNPPSPSAAETNPHQQVGSSSYSSSQKEPNHTAENSKKSEQTPLLNKHKKTKNSTVAEEESSCACC